MSQYAWSPMFKTVPTDGPEELFDLTELFPETTGPVKIEASHDAVMTQREDVNRNLSPRNWGFRGEVKFTFQIVDTYYQQFIAALSTRLMQDTWTVYCSLDAGLNWRRVILTDYTGPKALGGKTFAGCEYTLTVQAAELDDTVPVLGTGSW